MTRPAPLAGLRVIDLTQVLAGPYCTYQLALLGAEVVKVEPPAGELARSFAPYADLGPQQLGLGFCAQNSDKDCVTIDLKAPGGVEEVLRLAAEADVFIENYRPGVADRLGIGEATVRELNPRIVYCSISAYGGGGEENWEPSQAETPAPVPTWAWVLLIFIITWAMYYAVMYWKPEKSVADSPTYQMSEVVQVVPAASLPT